MTDLFIHSWMHTVMTQKLKVMHFSRNTWEPDCGLLFLSLFLLSSFILAGGFWWVWEVLTWSILPIYLIAIGRIQYYHLLLYNIGFYYSCYPVLIVRNEMFRFYILWASWGFFCCCCFTQEYSVLNRYLYIIIYCKLLNFWIHPW